MRAWLNLVFAVLSIFILLWQTEARSSDSHLQCGRGLDGLPSDAEISSDIAQNRVAYSDLLKRIDDESFWKALSSKDQSMQNFNISDVENQKVYANFAGSRPPSPSAFDVCRSNPAEPFCHFYLLWGWDVKLANRVLFIRHKTGVRIGRTGNIPDKKWWTKLDDVLLLERALALLPSDIANHFNKVHLSFDPAKTGGASTSGTLVFIPYPVLNIFGPGLRTRNGTLRVDARLTTVIHELGHVLDMNRKIGAEKFDNAAIAYSQQKDWKDLVNDILPLVYPWHPFDEVFFIFSSGAYEGPPHEQFAEFFSQYFFLPKQLRSERYKIWEFMHDKIFHGVEFSGFEDCTGGTFSHPLIPFGSIDRFHNKLRDEYFSAITD